MSGRKVNGRCHLTMPDGTRHTISNRLILQLIDEATTAMGAPVWPIPQAIYERFPQLEWFRDCKSAYSEDGDHIFEIVFLFVKGPAATPADQPVEQGSAA